MTILHKQSLKNILVISLVIGAIIPTIYGIFLGVSNSDPHISQWIWGFIYSSFITFIIIKINSEIVHDMQVQFPWFKSARKRFIYELIFTSISAGVTITIFYFLLKGNVPMDSNLTDAQAITENVIIAVVANFVIVSFLEGKHFLSQWKEYYLEAETLKRRNVEMQYNVLAQQIDPHFLFNSLNALAALIPEDPKKAVKFTREFSRIYRYVLDVKTKYIVSVKEELDFLHSYIFLHQNRFGEKLNTDIKIDSAALDYFIPPLSLQILVENAIKHNEISSEKPLRIEILNQDHSLIIKNDYQPRKARSESPGTGLANLTERYSHFSDAKPEFGLEDGLFIAKIPLIKDE